MDIGGVVRARIIRNYSAIFVTGNKPLTEKDKHVIRLGKDWRKAKDEERVEMQHPTPPFLLQCYITQFITKGRKLLHVFQDADKSAKKKAAAASLGGQQEMTPEELQAEEEVGML